MAEAYLHAKFRLDPSNRLATANSSNLGASRLKTEYVSKRFSYQGQPYDENRFAFDAELIDNVIGKMKRGKAAGLDGITCEHLLFSHPLLPGILAKLFTVIS